MRSPWSEEILRLLGVGAAGLFLGLLAGSLPLGLFLALAAYFAWHLRQQHRLYRWVSAARNAAPPEAGGLWGATFDQFYQLQRRNRRRKKRLRTIVREFRQSTAAMPDGTVVLDAGNRIVWFNSAGERLLRLRTPQDNGQHVLNLIRHPDFVAYFEAGHFAEPVEIDSPVTDRVRLSLQIIPYGEDHRLLIARDVSRIHQLEKVRRDFVANASHELRTPLTVITGYLEALREDDTPAMEPWHRPVTEMHRQAERMRNILEDLLLLSRLDAQPNPSDDAAVDVAGITREICRDSRFIADGRVRVDCDTDPALGIHGVSAELHSAFSNLVQNAVKYTPEGGEIQVRWRSEGEYGLFEVSDTGIGIPPEHIPRLTERFYRVDASRSRSRGGTGLGLAIVRHALQRHDATLEITSRQGQGSSFLCRFPRQRLRPLDADATPAPGEQRIGRSA